MPKLNACPFCGCEKTRTDSDVYLSTIMCSNCQARVSVGNQIPNLNVREKWNHRPIEDALRERIKEMEAHIAAQEPPLEWHTCDGSPESLPTADTDIILVEINRPNIKKSIDAFVRFGNAANEWELACTGMIDELYPGDRWAYIPKEMKND